MFVPFVPSINLEQVRRQSKMSRQQYKKKINLCLLNIKLTRPSVDCYLLNWVCVAVSLLLY